MRLMERSSRTPLDVGAYLRRIHHEPPRAPTAEALASLHRAHLFAIPFENLDIHRRSPIRLEEGSLFDKIVRR
jgi:N-hydroxyarylamine O-acetyltransferase